MDIKFVDRDDRVRCFSRPNVIRTPAVLGRRDVAAFWIRFGERFVYIRYFPVRGRSGEYLGTLEVSQEVGPIQKLSGERRLLDA